MPNELSDDAGQLNCPVSQTLLEDPVVVHEYEQPQSAHVFSRASIIAWQQQAIINWYATNPLARDLPADFSISCPCCAEEFPINAVRSIFDDAELAAYYRPRLYARYDLTQRERHAESLYQQPRGCWRFSINLIIRLLAGAYAIALHSQLMQAAGVQLGLTARANGIVSDDIGDSEPHPIYYIAKAVGIFLLEIPQSYIERFDIPSEDRLARLETALVHLLGAAAIGVVLYQPLLTFDDNEVRNFARDECIRNEMFCEPSAPSQGKLLFGLTMFAYSLGGSCLRYGKAAIDGVVSAFTACRHCRQHNRGFAALPQTDPEPGLPAANRGPG